MASPQLSERPLTADEFYELSDPDEGGKMELIEGMVVVEMPPGGEHGGLTSRLIISLGVFIGQHALGTIVNEAGFRLAQDPDTVLAPDVAFLASSAATAGKLPTTYISGWPTLAIEVVSPHDRASKIMKKVDYYLGAGVERVWLVRPKRATVTVYSTGGGTRTRSRGDVLTSDDAGFAVDGFALPIDDLFA